MQDCYELGVILLKKKLYTQATKNLDRARKAWTGPQNELAQASSPQHHWSRRCHALLTQLALGRWLWQERGLDITVLCRSTMHWALPT